MILLEIYKKNTEKSEIISSLTSRSHLFLFSCRWLRTVETVGRQYAFIKFGSIPLIFFVIHSSSSSFIHLVDRIIQKKRRDYLDPNSTSNMKKLNDDLQSIHNIMRKTIDDVLDRGNKLDG